MDRRPLHGCELTVEESRGRGGGRGGGGRDGGGGGGGGYRSNGPEIKPGDWEVPTCASELTAFRGSC